jgi:hypothetical protein
MHAQALRVAIALALFKSNPAEMPFSPALTRLAVGIAVASTALLLAGLVPLPLAIATGAGGAGGVAFFTRQLLRGRKLDNRFGQTLTAQLLVGSLFALAMWPAMLALAPVMQEMLTSMRAAAESGGSVSLLQIPAPDGPQVPMWAALWSDLLFIWSLAVSARIYRLAAEVPVLASWAFTVMSLFVVLGFVLLSQLVAAAFFGTA